MDEICTVYATRMVDLIIGVITISIPFVSGIWAIIATKHAKKEDVK